MLISWFTVISQIVNFLILVWLLKRFLYKPILNAIDAREKLIADKLEAAEADMNAAQKERKEFNDKNEEFEVQRGALLRKAEEEANQLRLELLDTARKDSEELQQRWNKTLLDNEKILNNEVKLRTQQEIFAIVQKMLADLSGTTLEENIIDVFVRKVADLSQEDKAQIVLAFKANPEETLIRSMFEVSSDQKALIKMKIKEELGIDSAVRFEAGPELISGIEIIINDRKISWNISDYLTSLEENMKEFLDKGDFQ